MPTFDESSMNKDCCICGGPIPLYVTHSAHIIKDGKEYRVHYHSACFGEHARKTIEEKLNKMATSG